jgi:protoporphyrinogen oxidase
VELKCNDVRQALQPVGPEGVTPNASGRQPESLSYGGSGLSRRDLLKSLLAAPLATLASCGKNFAFTGEVLGASMSLGHRLRDQSANAARSEPATTEESKIVIIGGGLAGLAAAWRLRKAGVEDFVVLELEPRPGGTASFGSSSVSAYPWGAHYVPVPLPENRLLTTILHEVGAIESLDAAGRPIFAEQFLCREPEERIFANGDWHEGLYLSADASTEDLAELERFRAEVNKWVDWRGHDERRAFALPTAHCSTDPEVRRLDQISMAAWLDEYQFHSPRLRWLVDYSCRDDFGSTIEDTSAWAGLFYFAARVAKAGDDSQPLITWPEGLGRLVSHFADPLGDRFRTGIGVMRIEPNADSNAQQASSEIAIHAITADDGRSLRWNAGRVILAAPQFVVPHLVPDFPEDRRSACRSFEYGAWLVANIHLRDRPPSTGFEAAWDNVLYDSRSLGYVVATHQSGVDHGPTVWTYYLPICDRPPREARAWLSELTWSQAAGLVVADLEQAHPTLRDSIERLDIMKWGHAMVRSSPGFVTSPERLLAATPWRGLHFAGTDLSGVPLCEEAIYHGVRAAEELLASLNIESESLL